MNHNDPYKKNDRFQPSFLRGGTVLIWLFVLIGLSYKKKIIGQAGVRPLYLLTIAIGCGLLVYLLLRVIRTHHIRWTSAPEAITASALVLCIGYIFAQSIIYPESLTDAIYTSSTVFFIYVLSALTIITLGWKQNLLHILAALTIYSIANVILATLNLINPTLVTPILVPPLETGYGLRISGLPGDPTHLGAQLSITLMLMWLLRPKYSKWHTIPCTLIILVALIATGTRNAILSLILGITAVALMNKSIASFLIKYSSAVLAISIIIVLGMAITPDGIEYISTLFRFSDPNSYSRIDVWRAMIDLFSQSSWMDLIFGGGYLYIQSLYGSPYNAFIRILFNQGLIFVMPFIGITLYLLWLAAIDDQLQRKQIAVALLTYWISFSMFLDTSFAEFFHFSEFCFWLAAALLTTRTITPKQHLNFSGFERNLHSETPREAK